ncbi:MAG: pilus assembly FimT family protein [Minisyncoccota bacterium]
MKYPVLKSRGFTMVELLVTAGIFIMLTSVVLAKYRTFNTHATFVNSVENLVFSLRQAQVYGSSTKGNKDASGNFVTCGTGTAFECAYGVHISPSDPSYAYKIFVDVNDDKIYNVGDIDIETVARDNSISYGFLGCGAGGTPCAGDFMDVTFKRPSPDAYIVDSLGAPYDLGSVTISSSITQDVATITITSAGQLSIQ